MLTTKSPGARAALLAILGFAALCAGARSGAAQALDIVSAASPGGTAPAAPGDGDVQLDVAQAFVSVRQRHLHDRGNDRVSLGHDTDLAAGQRADSVVSVGGSSSSEGSVRDDVVSILGSTRVTGPVGHDAVAVAGSTYVDSHVGGDVVAVLGSVRLGPHAEVDGNVTAVGGRVERDPAAIVHGAVQQVAVGAGPAAGAAAWASPWVRHGMLYLRPLAWAFGLAWAWALAVGFLALYVCLALVFPGGVQRCVRTLETQPGPTVLTAVLAALLTPVLLVLLVITLIGIAAVPLVLLALLLASVFGKAAMLSWLGQRVLGIRGGAARAHPALGVLIGGVLVLALYFVPVLGFLVFQALALMGLGVVIYTLVVAARTRQGTPAAGAPPPPPPAPPPGRGPPGSRGPEDWHAQPATPVEPATVPHAAPPPSASAPLGAAAASGPAAPEAALSGAAPSHRQTAMDTDSVPLGPYAGFWVRLGALLLDALVIGIVAHLLPQARHLELLALAVYGAVMWKLRGTTIGGIVFDLQVVRVDGRPLDWTTVIVRALGCFLSLAIVGLGFFWIAFDDCKQAWHDKFAGTVVVRMAKAASLV